MSPSLTRAYWALSSLLIAASRYLTPPWTSLVLLLLVPSAKSFCSNRATDSPRKDASNAMPAPVAPPPITIISKLVFFIMWNVIIIAFGLSLRVIKIKFKIIEPSEWLGYSEGSIL